MSKWDDVMRKYGTAPEDAANDYVKATNVLPFTVGDIQQVFTAQEMDEVAVFVTEMKQAGEDNQKQAQLLTQYSKAAVGLLKLARVLV